LFAWAYYEPVGANCVRPPFPQSLCLSIYFLLRANTVRPYDHVAQKTVNNNLTDQLLIVVCGKHRMHYPERWQAARPPNNYTLKKKGLIITNIQIKTNIKPHRRYLHRSIALLMILSLLLSLAVTFSGCDDKDPVGEDTHPETQTPNAPEESAPSETPQKRVAITFDDGPHNVWTKQIVNELGRYGFTATFFVLGNRVDGTDYRGGETMAFAASQGHEIAIHGYTHEVYYNKCSDAEYDYELSETAKVISAYGGGTPTLMRPIGGSITSERVAACPYAVVKWDVDSEDWRHKYKSEDTPEVAQEKIDTIVNNVMSTVHDGSIILLHDIYESTYDATCIILARLHEEGYDVVSVSELLENPVPGTLYYQK